MRRELEYQIQVQISSSGSEIIIMLKELFIRQIVPFRPDLLEMLAKEHRPAPESMNKQTDIYYLGKRRISNTWAEVSA